MHDTFWVYIMSNKTRSTLYTGVTNDLERRVHEHRFPETKKSFTARYFLNRLVWCESFPTALDAIATEKRIKGWTRAKKVTLINEQNPNWKDLSEGWYE